MEKKAKTYEESLEEFINQLKLAGVTPKTIQKVLEEINAYQTKLWKQTMKDMFKNMKKNIMEDIYE